MNFPENWFDDEVRDGFYVSSIVKREWAARMEVLHAVDMVCERHHLRWFMAFGSMLGAIRHHGYIPWDDDVDIFIPEDDYNKFIRYAPLELPDGFVVHDEREPGYHEFISVVGANFDPKEKEEFSRRFHDFPFAPGVDLFRLDYISDNEEDENWRDAGVNNVLYTIGRLSTHSDDIFQAAEVDVDHVKKEDLEKLEDYDWMKEIRQGFDAIKETTGHKFNQEDPVMDQLYLLYEGLASYFKPEESSRMAYLVEWMRDPERKYNCYPKEMADHLMKVPFETMEVNVPVDYEYHLKMRFGSNYMTPVKAAGTHFYPSFRKMQDKVLMSAGFGDTNPWEYSFSEKDIEERPAKREDAKTSVKEFLTTMEKLHAILVQINRPDTAEMLLQVLESCQNAAIQIGDCIEKARSEEFAEQFSIQEYAEAAYQMYDKIVQAGKLPTEEEVTAFQTLFQTMRTAIEKGFLQRKEVVFVPYTARKWNAMESLWRACMQDPDCDVYVVPTPTYEKDMTNALKPGQHYDLDQYPEEIHAISYQDYDVWKRHPDYIFIQNPYDQYNYATIVDSSMYSRILYLATDHLVYIPWFVTCEFGIDSHDDVAAMDFYVKVPGVVRSDLTVVQSEKIADTYRQVLTKFAGENTKEIWDRKIQGWGSPLQDEKGSVSPLWKKIQNYFEAEESGNK